MIQFITLSDLLDYQDIVNLMEKHVTLLINKSIPETVYLVEHKDVYTAGTNFKDNELLNTNNVPVIYTGRGGGFTYHGPGQRVIYPILDLSIEHRKKDIKLYIKMLEEWIINSLLYLDIKAFAVNERVGVWVKDNGVEKKIASIGVRVKKWVTYHGVAINISTNLNMFSGIIACGLRDYSTTSLQNLGVNIKITQFDKIIQTEFKRVFN